MCKMKVFEYGEKELEHLKNQDEKIGLLIDEIGFIERKIIPDYFSALVNSIAGQQISTKAAETIWRRILDKFGKLTPEKIISASVDELRSCGLSGRKVSYIQGIGEAVISNQLNFSEFPNLSDEEIVSKLIEIKGIGIWTAEMFLIFSMKRPNVLSYGDLGIRKGIMNLHNLDSLDKDEFDYYKKLYSPYCSIASLYLWEIANK